LKVHSLNIWWVSLAQLYQQNFKNSQYFIYTLYIYRHAVQQEVDMSSTFPGPEVPCLLVTQWKYEDKVYFKKNPSQTSIWKVLRTRNPNPLRTYKFDGRYLSLRKAKFEDPYLRNHAINQNPKSEVEENSFKNNIYQFYGKKEKNPLHQSYEVTPYVCLQISCDDAFYAFWLA
jgi:hypothetical protein